MYLYFLTSTHPRRVKIGIGWHLYRRHKQVDKTTRGCQRVLVAFIMPLGARWAETLLHRRYKQHSAPLKYGSGRSEYFKRGFLDRGRHCHCRVDFGGAMVLSLDADFSNPFNFCKMKYTLQNPGDFLMQNCEIIGHYLYWTNKNGFTQNAFCKTSEAGKRLFYREFGKGAKWKKELC